MPNRRTCRGGPGPTRTPECSTTNPYRRTSRRCSRRARRRTGRARPPTPRTEGLVLSKLSERGYSVGSMLDHVGINCSDLAAAQAFYDTAMDAGAESLHAPRLRPEYHPGYYGAFVRDPDGNNVEAVIHHAGPED